jgi:hypothetical protein
MILRAFLLPQTQLRQMVEMCMTVGLEPEHYDEMSASCDAETLARWVEEEWIDIEAAEELREIYRHGLRVLANDWNSGLTPEAVTQALSPVALRQEPTEDGKPEACVLDLQPAFRADLIQLIAEAAGDRQIELSLTSGLRDLINDLFPSHSFYLHSKVPASRRLGPRGEGRALSFQTGLEIFGYSFYGIPELQRLAEVRLQESERTPSPELPRFGVAHALNSEEAFDLIEMATLLKLASSERLTWVGALEQTEG